MNVCEVVDCVKPCAIYACVDKPTFIAMFLEEGSTVSEPDWIPTLFCT